MANAAPPTRTPRKRDYNAIAAVLAIVVGIAATFISLASLGVAIEANRIAAEANRSSLSASVRGFVYDSQIDDAPCWATHASRGEWGAQPIAVVEIVNDGPQAIALRSVSTQTVDSKLENVLVWVLAEPITSESDLSKLDTSGRVRLTSERLRLEKWPTTIQPGDAALLPVAISQLVVIFPPATARQFQTHVEGVHWMLTLQFSVGSSRQLTVEVELPRPWEQAREALTEPSPMDSYPICQ
jgi:hypothetical protein